MIRIDDIEIDEVDYAIRRNAMVGVNETGKTYGATWFAEQLMDAGIPIVAIDPAGVWRWLQIGKNRQPGYPVVVVGDDADLPLSVNTAGNIMRAALEEGVSIVFDLYSRHLTKADWRRIVVDISEVLWFENKTLRHVFLEEAKDYVPQRIYDTKAYSAVERLVSMGGNAKLGITLLGQRAENINKEVLELCVSLFSFRQVGRNSLNNLSKWLKSVDADSQDYVIKSLLKLKPGECWFWDEGSTKPVMLHIPAKKTEHPNRRETETLVHPKSSVDVSGFVERMLGSLRQQDIAEEVRGNIDKKRKTKVDKAAGQLAQIVEQPDYLREEVERLNAEINTLNVQLREEQQRHAETQRKLSAMREYLLPQYSELSRLLGETNGNGTSLGENVYAPAGTLENNYWQPFLDRLGDSAPARVLQVLIQRKHATHHQLRLLARVNSTRTLSNAITTLVTKGLARREGSEIVLREIDNP